MRALYNNIVMTADMTFETENLNYPADNLLDTRQSRYYRTLLNTAQRITFEKTAAEASYVVIMNHNLSPTATVKLQADDTDVTSTPDFDETLDVDDIIILNFTKDTYNFWSLYIDDPDNTDDYIQIAYIFIGDFLQLPGMKPDQTLPFGTTSKSALSTGGQVFGSHGYEYRGPADFNFPFVTDTQRKAINTLFAAVRNYIPFVLLIWANDLDFEPPIYAMITNSDLKWAKSDNVLYPWKVTLQIREVF